MPSGHLRWSVVPLLLAVTVGAQEIPRPDAGASEQRVRERLATLADRLGRQPEDPEAWGRYGMALEAHDFTEEALVCYTTAARLDAEDFRWPYLAATLLDQVDVEASLLWYERALDIDSSYAPAQIRFAEVLERLARYEEARRVYRRAVRLDEDNPFGHFGLGRLALQDGETAEALRHLERAYGINPGIRALVATLANAYHRSGRREMALQKAAEAKSLPRNTYRPDPIRAAVKREGVDVRAFLGRSKTYRDTGQLEAALREAQRAIEVEPGFAPAHFAVAELLTLLGRHAEAVAPAERALQLDPDFDLVPPLLAQLHLEAEHFDEAAAYARRSLELDPSAASMHLLLAMVAARFGKIDDVVQQLESAYDLRPSDPETRRLLESLMADLAASFADVGLYESAVANGERVLDLLRDRSASPAEIESAEQALARYRAGHRRHD